MIPASGLAAINHRGGDSLPANEADPSPSRPEIALSWRRSALSGIQPDSSVSINVAEFDDDSRLLRSAAPVLEELGESISATELCVALANRDGQVVRRVFGDPTVVGRFENYGLVTGALFSEDIVVSAVT